MVKVKEIVANFKPVKSKIRSARAEKPTKSIAASKMKQPKLIKLRRS